MHVPNHFIFECSQCLPVSQPVIGGCLDWTCSRAPSLRPGSWLAISQAPKKVCSVCRLRCQGLGARILGTALCVAGGLGRDLAASLSICMPADIYLWISFGPSPLPLECRNAEMVKCRVILTHTFCLWPRVLRASIFLGSSLCLLRRHLRLRHVLFLFYGFFRRALILFLLQIDFFRLSFPFYRRH